MSQILQKIQCPELPRWSILSSLENSLQPELLRLQTLYPDAFSVLGHEQKMQFILDELNQQGDARSTYLRPAIEPLAMSTWSINASLQSLDQANKMASIILCKPSDMRTPEMQGIAANGGRVQFESIAESKCWIDDIRRVDLSDRPPLEKAAYRFMRTISAHPFRDGNGRIARTLIYGPFAAANILKLPILGITAIFDIHRLELSRRVVKLSDDADWQDFFEYFTFLLNECIKISTLVAERNLELKST